ncbi:VirD4-like conjugal transfer protein, CD1115 family [Sulfobacillus harzensis]|uniref:Type IV secretory system conjugative DNA transfer family protein n=1 Tax=Sulfobacillus harzensis TaxID=2729629 RepID=A0A7Y0L5M3_9FIRM|nr:type IV secretory system conjugative DNA transfer family protein [Sulfobacillus harzensis]NMP23488.1 type IV secretory system conjugative DNA transfer family protein [Sulfobacillus harzensis]
MKTRTLRTLVLVNYGLAVSVCVLPAVVSLGIRLRGTSSGQWEGVLQAWASRGLYLPWRAIADGAHDPRTLIWLSIFVALAGIGMGLLGAFSPRVLWGGPPASGQGQHGTARWRSSWELQRSLAQWRPQMASPPNGLVVGQGRHQSAWVVDQEGHALVVGATRSGKGRRILLPTIGVIGRNRRDSLLVTDPKGELFAHSAAFLRSQGYMVRRIDFRDPRLGLRFNPLAPVSEALHDARVWTVASQAAWDIAHVLSDHGADADPFWSQAQEALTAALILGIADQAPSACRHLASVYATLIEAGKREGKELDAWMATFPEDHPARMAYGSVALSTERTRTSIFTGAATALRLFADPDMAWLTAKSSYSLDALADQPEAHFLIIPDDRATRYPIVTLYLTQVIQALNSRAQRDGGRLPRTVHFLLDEVGNLPPIPDLDKTVTVAAGRGIRLTLVLQDLQQLKSRYRDAAGTILGNTATWVYLITQDWDTASLLSKKLGEYTTEVRTLSHAHASWWRPVTMATGTAQESHALTGRPLLTPDELMRWPEGQSLVLQTRLPPARLSLPDLSEWRAFQALANPSAVEAEPAPLERVPVWWPGKAEDSRSEEVPAGLAGVWRRSREAGVLLESVPDW